MIMKKNYKIYASLLAAIIAIMSFAGCTEDIFGSGNVKEGMPITVNLTLGTTPAKDIVISRASGKDLSTLNDLTIYIFDGDGNYQQTVSTADKTLTLGQPTGNSDVNYSAQFTTTSGTKNLLAVGNSASSWWKANGVNPQIMTFEELKSLLIDLNYTTDQNGEIAPISITSSDQMLITGWNQGIVFDTNGSVSDWGESERDIAIKMKRAMANVTFNIVENPTGAKGTFTPTSYKVYNVPVNSFLANMENAVTSGTDTKDSFVDYASSNISAASGGNYTFGFYMPENIYGVVSGVETYAARDTWESNTAYKLNKDWTEAPDYSTFVVISGTYEESGDNPYTGNVAYTIHLGDFSSTGSMGNFSVERNCSYTYNVSVLGVDNIVVEAKKENGTYQQGAEGQIYDLSNSAYSYILDAHFEQVFLEYNLTDIATAARSALSSSGVTNPTDDQIDKAIADQLILVIKSEAMDATYNHEYSDDEPYEISNYYGTLKPYQIYINNGNDAQSKKEAILNGHFDYKWIEFWPQTNTDIASYPGVSSWSREDLDGFSNTNFYGGNTTDDSEHLIDAYDVVVAMGKAVKKIMNDETISTGDYEDGIIITQSNRDYVARFTAFVNENYYIRHPLTGGATKVWSTFTNKQTREMIIAMSSDISTDGNSSYNQVYTYISQLSIQTFYNSRVSDINGLGVESYNETPLYEFAHPREDRLTPLSYSNGFANQNTLLSRDDKGTNWSTYISAANNGWKQTVGNDRSSHKLNSAYETEAAYAACLSRNRDLNGNGTIDQSEIRWYLPSVVEYIRLGIGENAMSSLANLYLGDKGSLTNNGYPANFVKEGALYYTSSPANQRLFWAVEKGSYGEVLSSYLPSDSGAPIRCIRSLPATADDNDITSWNVVSDPVYEWDETNRVLDFRGKLVDVLYRGRVNTTLGVHDEDDHENSFYDGIIVAKNFSPNSYTLRQIINLGGNQANPCAGYSEEGDGGATWRVPNLVELSAMNSAGLLAHSGNSVACCTQFSNQDVRFGFVYSTLITCPGGSNTQTYNDPYQVRCVRDVPTGYFNTSTTSRATRAGKATAKRRR